jgi:hypothetical protein
MPAMPKLPLNYVMHQSSIIYGSYILDRRLPGSLEKVPKTGKQGIFRKKSEETSGEDFLGEE